MTRLGRIGPGVLADELHRVLAVHVLLSPVYAFWILIGFGSQFLWASILMQSFTWVTVPFLFVHWAHQGRGALTSRVCAWALLSWATPLGLPFLVLIPFTRKLLVPPLPDSTRWPIWTTGGSVL